MEIDIGDIDATEYFWVYMAYNFEQKMLKAIVV